MLRSNRLIPLLLTLLLLSCTPAKETLQDESRASIHEEVAGLIVNMPASDPAEQTWLNEQLLEMGPSGIRVLAGMLTPRGTGDDTHVRYALSSLANYVSGPGAESDRSAFEEALLGELRGDYSVEAKTFLLNQLKQTGSDRSVELLESFLTDNRLYQPAIEVLITLGTPRAIQAIRNSLSVSDVEGSRRIAWLKALGDLKDDGAVEEIETYASAEDWPTRRMAYYALSRSGSPPADDVFVNALESPETNRQRQREIVSFYLAYAERLSEEGHYDMSREISRGFLSVEYPVQVRSRALHTLFKIEGEKIQEELRELTLSADSKLAAAALEKLNSIEGPETTEWLVSALNKAPEPRKAAILRALGTRGDPNVADDLKPFLNGNSRQTRVAVTEALVRLNGQENLPVLIAVLNRAEDEGEIEEIETVLRQIPTRELIAASAEALPSASDLAKPALIRILADRRASDYLDVMVRQAGSESETVRLEVYRALQILGGPDELHLLASRFDPGRSEEEVTVIQKAIVGIAGRQDEASGREVILIGVWDEASEDQKPFLLRIFPQVDGPETLSVVREALNHSDETIRRAAMTALSEWPDPRALPALLEAARVADEEVLPDVFAGYVRLIRRSGHSLEEKETNLHELVKTADTSGKKAVVLSHISEAGELTALWTVSRYFDDEEEEVRRAAIRVASGLLVPSYDPDSGSVRLNSTSAVLAVMDENTRRLFVDELDRRVNEMAEEEASDQHAAEGNEEVPLPEAVYGQLFNGRDLEGWEVVGGSSEGWGVENGILYTEGEESGWLSSASVYDNFILELEYRVPDAGNSGVFLRAPREGNPAYEGMEIQILDDDAGQYAELEPWQYTGSVYGVKAPSKRVTKPAGEWQHMVIRADGPEVRVALNGELIVNTSLIRHMELTDNHPGLIRRSGFIGLQDHGDRVEFRNIVIHKIE
ncbi:MAG: family 16 glycoside hydrolase [Balneolaceae bacterium]